jgi:hypothetical protein
MAKNGDAGKDRTEADAWRDATSAFELWHKACDRTRFNRRIVEVSPTADYNQRLLYLTAVAFCRRVERLFPDPCCHRVLQVAEAYAEGIATLEELETAHEDVEAVDDSNLPALAAAAVWAAFWLNQDDSKVGRAMEMLIDVAGYRAAVTAGVLAAHGNVAAGRAVWQHPAFIAGKEEEGRALCDLIRDVLGNPFQAVEVNAEWLRWNNGLAVQMAEVITNERAFDRLPILADALEEAGCPEETILSHCRSPGPHVRGCWVLDLVRSVD